MFKFEITFSVFTPINPNASDDLHLTSGFLSFNAFNKEGMALLADSPNFPKERAVSRRTFFFGSFKAYSSA
ncbi:hypothetical protein ES705_39115 [subsurface metagenome]